YFTGADRAALTALTSVGRAILGKTSTQGVLDYLGLGEAAKMPAATALASSAGNITIPVLIGGVQRTALLQWKTLSVPQSTDGNMVVVDGSWPVAFPNACLSINPSLVNSVIYATNGAPFVSAAIVDRVKFKAACAYTKSNSTVAVWGVGY
ncbi:phage tail protein, partial [Escherichia coli]